MLLTCMLSASCRLFFLFKVAAKLETHGREKFACEIRFAARREPLVKSVGQNGAWRAGLDARYDRPAPFAGIGDAAGVALQRGLLQQGDGGQIEKPRGDHTAAAPHFGDVGEIEVIL